MKSFAGKKGGYGIVLNHLENIFLVKKDLIDKEAALDVDTETAHLKVTGPMKKTRETRYPAPKPKQSFAPHSWQEFTEKNLDWANGKYVLT